MDMTVVITSLSPCGLPMRRLPRTDGSVRTATTSRAVVAWLISNGTSPPTPNLRTSLSGRAVATPGRPLVRRAFRTTSSERRRQYTGESGGVGRRSAEGMRSSAISASRRAAASVMRMLSGIQGITTREIGRRRLGPTSTVCRCALLVPHYALIDCSFRTRFIPVG